MFDISLKASQQHDSFWLVELENDSQAKLIASRSITLFCVLEYVYSSTPSSVPATVLANFHKGFKKFMETESDDNRELIKNYFNKNRTFRVTVETRNKKISLKQKIQKIEDMNYLPIKGT